MTTPSLRLRFQSLTSRVCRRVRELFRQPRHRSSRQPGQRPISQSAAFACVEPLEDRTLLSALTVNTTADDTAEDTVLSLREAILLVNNAGDAQAALGRDLTTEELAQIDSTTEAFGTNDTVTFDANLIAGGPATILMTGGQFRIEADLILTGLGADQLTIDAQNASRIFFVGDGDRFSEELNVQIAGLTLTNGNADGVTIEEQLGGAIFNDKTLTLVDVTMTQNTAAARGGGLYNRFLQTTTLESSRVTNNLATNEGGGLYNAGDGIMTLTNTLVANNSASVGGGIYNGSFRLNVFDSTITENTANDSGGGLRGGFELTVDNSLISRNTAMNNGGGILLDRGGRTRVTNSLLSQNSAANDGGAIYHLDSQFRLTNSIVDNNTAGNAGGGIATFEMLIVENSTLSANTASVGDGGGISIENATLTLTASTLRNNFSQDGGAGLFVSSGTANVTASTFSRNETGGAGHGGGIHSTNGSMVMLINSTLEANDASCFGGGVYNSNSTLELFNTTVSGNRETHGGGGGIHNTGMNAVTIATNSTIVFNRTAGTANSGGGIHNANNGQVTLFNTIVAGNTATGGGGSPSDLGTLTLQPESANNLIGDPNTAGGLMHGDANNNIVGQDDGASGRELLDLSTVLDSTLRTNGGFTQNHALLMNSPAIDAGNDTFADDANLTTDQRGVPFLRKSGTVDIGAFELQGLTQAIVVDTLDDTVNGDTSPGDLSLREAIEIANGAIGADTITFDFGVGHFEPATITLTNGQFVIRDDVTITGLGADQLTIDADQNSRIFEIETDIMVDIAGMTLTNGLTTGDGGAIFNFGTLTLTEMHITGNTATGLNSNGGGIRSVGDLTLRNSIVSQNSASLDGGGLLSFAETIITDSVFSQNTAGRNGGGVNAFLGTLAIQNSTFDENSAGQEGGGLRTSSIDTVITGTTISRNSANLGGGIFNNGDIVLVNSTVSQNSAGSRGGGVLNRQDFTLINSTVTGNRASNNGGGILTTDFNVQTTRLLNSIVAGNFQGTNTPNDLGGRAATADSANNIVSENVGNFLPTGNNNQVIADVSTVLDTTLQNNGGPTETHALISGSPAINAGDNTLALDADDVPLEFDQRGEPFARTFGTVDIGAFEFQTLNLVVDTTDDIVNGNTAPGDLSLREAIELANTNPGADTITFDFGVGHFEPPSILLAAQPEGNRRLEITDDLTITGLGSDQLTIDADQNSRIFNVRSEITVDIAGMTLTNGRTTSSGGAIFNEGTLTLTGMNITGNTATGLNSDGGGILSFGDLTLRNSIVSQNSASLDGGGLWSQAETIITDSVFSQNTAGRNGGGANAFDGALTIQNSTFDENSAGSDGGGIFTDTPTVITETTISRNSAGIQAGGILNHGNFVLVNSTVSQNTAGNRGGGFFNIDELTLINSTVTGNRANNAGGGILTEDSAPVSTSLSNSIVAGNFQGANTPNDLEGKVATADSANNIVSENAGNLLPAGNNNQVIADVSTVLDTTLQNNGGPTETHALISDSPAINAGDNTLALDTDDVPLEFDQRGEPFLRQIGTVDIGAFEDQTRVVSIGDVSTVEGSSGSTILTFEVTLNATLDEDLTFDFTTIEDSALAGSDFTAVNGMGTITAGDTITTIEVEVLGDLVVENDEQFFVELSNLNANGLDVTLDGDGRAIGTILNDDQLVVTANDFGEAPEVRATHAGTDTEVADFLAYDEGFLGGVRVATGDVTGDGVPDIITGAGPSGGPHIKVFDGVSGDEIRSFFAFEENFRGVYVAAGDMDGDGLVEIAVAGDAGGTPEVRVFSGVDSSELMRFFAYDENFQGGVRLAVGDISGDGIGDIITGPGFGGGPHVKVFDGSVNQSGMGTQIPGDLGSFNAYDPAFTGGIFVATGDVDGDSQLDIITGAGAGGGPHIKVFSGGLDGLLPTAIGDFFAYGEDVTGGVRVAASDVNGDGLADVVTVPASGSPAILRAFNADSPGTLPELLSSEVISDPDSSSGMFITGTTQSVFPPSTTLRLSGPITTTDSTSELSVAEVEPLFAEALSRFQSIGAPDQLLTALNALSIQVRDLSGDLLGLALPGTIVLDVNAAGAGWYLNPTPSTDDEFAEGSQTSIETEGRVDLLTVLLHELGHQLGADHHAESDHLLSETLSIETRQLPKQEDFDHLFHDDDLLDQLLSLSDS